MLHWPQLRRRTLGWGFILLLFESNLLLFMAVQPPSILGEAIIEVVCQVGFWPAPCLVLHTVNIDVIRQGIVQFQVHSSWNVGQRAKLGSLGCVRCMS